MKESNEMNQKKRLVWIISHYAGGPSFCPRIPDYTLAEYLIRQGYDVLIFASSAVHNTDINFIEGKTLSKREMVDGVPFVFIKTRSYKTRLDRVFNLTDFYVNLMRSYKQYGKPDLIISAMPQPLSCLAGVQIARKYKIPYITSIVDLWPLSIVEYADFSDKNPLIRALYLFEKWVYKKSDEMVFTWEGAYDYIVDKGWNRKIPYDKFHYINIGVNLKEFYENLNTFHVSDPDLEDDAFKVMYCGSVRTANDIGTVVSCAKKLNEKGYGDKIRFIIYGDGPDRETLIKRCEEEHIPNVVFKGYIDKKYIPYVLTKGNLNILNLKAAATQKYGNSSNKLFEYFAAGNPVIANIDEGKYPIISKYDCGKVVESESIEQYADGVEYFFNLSPGKYEAYRHRAKETAKLFDTEVLNREWEKILRNTMK